MAAVKITNMKLPGNVFFRLFQPGDEAAFRELNEQWIDAHFGIEEKDREVLGNPRKYVLDPGGAIVMAIQDWEAVGCCALLAMGDDTFEVAKMTVSGKLRGQGVGRRLLASVIEQAKTMKAKKLYLETNSKLSDAIHLYESLGFQHVPLERVQPSPYARANVFMEMPLEQEVPIG